jgi:hypothetical protein
MWPIYEECNLWHQNIFHVVAAACQKVACIPAEQDRLFGHYFRVTFYGVSFGDLHKKTYVYREKGLTHLYDLSNRLVQEYSEILQQPVELIKESEVKNMDPNVTAIQITFVEPYVPKQEAKGAFDIYHGIAKFYFDTPFTKGTAVHGSLGEQWLRRTLLTVNQTMPSIVTLVMVADMQVKEFQPARVAFRQLRDRTRAIENALAVGDFRKMQQLLHGSLLVQVNEGPSKMAEVFLSKLGGDEKYERKLDIQFREFLRVNTMAVAAHGKWAEDNPAFKALQDELEAGLMSLGDKLRYCLDRRG